MLLKAAGRRGDGFRIPALTAEDVCCAALRSSAAAASMRAAADRFLEEIPRAGKVSCLLRRNAAVECTLCGALCTELGTLRCCGRRGMLP